MATVPAPSLARTPLEWVGSSRKDLSEFPAAVKEDIGYALHQAQTGEKSACAKPLKGFGGAGVLEVVDDFDGDTFRGLHGQVQGRRLRASRVPEEVEEGP